MEVFSPSRIQTILDQTAKATGLDKSRNGRYTTHCFRRGGAQHRFMFASEKWSLKAVKWWGGWSEGEGTGTIMRYLLDEYIRYESGFGDMFNPERSDSRHSVFMGEADSKPVTQRAVNNLQLAVQKEIGEVRRDVTNLGSTMSRILQLLEQQAAQQPQLAASDTPQPVLQPVLQPTSVVQAVPVPVPADPADPADPASDEFGASTAPAAPKIPTARTWKGVLDQWYNGDVRKGLIIPLSKWTLRMRATSPSIYSQRKLIAKEWEYLGRNDKNMEDCHGKALKSIRALIDSIRDRNVEREEEDEKA